MRIILFNKDKRVKFLTLILTGNGKGGRWINFQWKPKLSIYGYWINKNFFLK